MPETSQSPSRPTVDLDAYRTALTMEDACNRLEIHVNGKRNVSCPFPEHDDQHPSATIYEDHLFCHGCGKRLDLIGLVGLTLTGEDQPRGENFWKVLEWVADQGGLARPTRDPKAQERYERRCAISEIYRQIFEDSQKRPQKAIEYLESRGISQEVAKSRVGFLPDGYTPQDPGAARRAGLLSKKGNFLFFDDRVIVPIFRSGKIALLYGRAMSAKTEPRHIYPATTSPSQPAAIWNLDNCRNAEEIWLCESIIDGMTMLTQGFEATAAVFGTGAMTDARLELLRQSEIRKINLVFDSDQNSAGQTAAMKTGEKLFRAGFEVHIVTLPLNPKETKTDVNSYFSTHKSSDFAKLPCEEFFRLACKAIPEKASPHEQRDRAIPLLELVADLDDTLLDKALLKRIKKRCPDFAMEALQRRLKEIRRKGGGKLPTGADFRPDPYADAVCRAAHVIFFADDFYFYGDGVYQARHDLQVKSIIQDLGRGLLKKSQLEDALHSLKIKTFRRPEAVNQPGILNVRNGFIDLQTDKPVLQSHTPDLLSTIQLPVSYDERAECPTFLEFIEQVVPASDLRVLLQEISGYLLVPDSSQQKAFILFGKTQSGKSTFLKILTELIGPPNVSHISLEKLGERFMTAQLAGKLVNVSSEVGVKSFVQDATIKALISGDSVTGENKNEKPFSFTPYCRLFAACNDFPLSADVSPAFFRRWVPIGLNRTIPAAEQDRLLDKKIIENELDGVFVWALAGLARLRKTAVFSICETSEAAVEKWRRSLDPVAEFASQFIQASPGSFALLQTTFKRYDAWIDRTNRRAHLTPSTLKNRLENLGISFKRRTPGWGMLDVALLPDLPNEDSM